MFGVAALGLLVYAQLLQGNAGQQPDLLSHAPPFIDGLRKALSVSGRCLTGQPRWRPSSSRTQRVVPRRLVDRVSHDRPHAGYLDDGRLPWHPSDTLDPVVNAVVDYRKIANQALEREANDIAATLGMPHRANIEPHQATALGLELPGEIDLLVADPGRGRLWVCEVKDVYAAVSPVTMRRPLEKFLDAKDGHVAQLSRSARAVAGNPDAAAKLLSAPSPAKPWRVLPLMITRRVEPAPFVEGVSVTFTVLADLADTLRSEVDPESGHTPRQ